jgi:hypothetical protein
VETFIDKLEEIVEKLVWKPGAGVAMLPRVKENRGTIPSGWPRCRETFQFEEPSEPEDLPIRLRLQEKIASRRLWEAGSAAKANQLAHEINNPLQTLANTIYLARQGGEDSEAYLREACSQLTALSELVKKVLEGNRL